MPDIFIDDFHRSKDELRRIEKARMAEREKEASMAKKTADDQTEAEKRLRESESKLELEEISDAEFERRIELFARMGDVLLRPAKNEEKP